MRRPSPALIVALVALFVALGGPAGAASLISGSQIKKNSITSKQVKNHSLTAKDLSRRAVRALEATPNGSITEAKLSNGAVTSGKLAGAAVTGAKMAAASVGPIQLSANSVSGPSVIDGSLTAADIARFSGAFSATVTAAPGKCWEQERRFAGADISNDVVYVMPGGNWPRQELGFTVVGSPHSDGFVISGCNRTSTDVTNQPVVFRYIVFHLG